MSALNVGRRSAIGANLVGRCARMRTPSPIVLRRRRSRHPVRRIPWRPFPFKRHLAGEPARAVPCPGRSNSYGAGGRPHRQRNDVQPVPTQAQAGSPRQPLTLTGRLAADAQIETPAPRNLREQHEDLPPVLLRNELSHLPRHQPDFSPVAFGALSSGTAASGPERQPRPPRVHTLRQSKAGPHRETGRVQRLL